MNKTSNQPFYFQGNNRGVLLFHSFTSNPVDVRGIGRAIAKEGYTVYGPLLTSHGGSLEETLVEPEVWIQDGYAGIQKLTEEGINQVACFGLSLGGLIAHQLVIELDSVIGGGSICSPMIAGYSTNIPEDFWHRYSIEKDKMAWSEEKIQEQKDLILTGVYGVLQGLDIIKQEMYPRFGAVSKPIFIAQGGADSMIEPQQAIELKDLYQHTEVDFHWYEAGGHHLSVGPFRKQLSQNISTFLAKLPWLT